MPTTSVSPTRATLPSKTTSSRALSSATTAHDQSARARSSYSPFRYPGGKRRLVPHTRSWLKAQPVPPTHLVEAFAGGAGVGVTALCEGLIARLTLIELDPELAHAWQTIFSDQADELAARLAAVSDVAAAYAILDGPAGSDPVGRALRLMLRNRVTFNGILLEGARELGRNGAPLPATYTYAVNSTAERIRLLGRYRDVVEVICDDALHILPRYAEAEDTVFYADPPYSLPGGPAKEYYRHWQLNHSRLFSVLAGLRGDVLVSHQDHPEVRRLAHRHGLHIAQVSLSPQANRPPELLMARELSWLASAPALDRRLVSDPATTAGRTQRHAAKRSAARQRQRQSKGPAVQVLQPLPLARLTGVNLSLLPVFAAVAEHLHFTRAAEALGTNKSSVSRRISELERQLGARLLDRTTQTVALTPDGQALYARARPALEAIHGALAAALPA